MVRQLRKEKNHELKALLRSQNPELQHLYEEWVKDSSNFWNYRNAMQRAKKEYLLNKLKEPDYIDKALNDIAGIIVKNIEF